MSNDEQLREEAQKAAAEMNLEFSKSTVMDIARQIYRRVLDTDRRTLEAS